CDTVSVMRAGRIVETGGIDDLFARPQHPYTQSLFDAVLEDLPARPSGDDRSSSAPTRTPQEGAVR
ncbi:MAG: ABC transporter, partial [Microbacterium sp.]|nr:ABC transporter [Microbacterium sp.]